MFALASLRIATRRVSAAAASTRAVRVTSRWVPTTLTRSFVTSLVRAEPARDAKSKTTPSVKKSAPKMKSAKITVKAKAKKAVKKPVKKTAKKKATKKPVKKAAKKPVKKATKLTIPRDIKIPSLGPSAYAYWSSKFFKAEGFRDKEQFAEVAKAASIAWRALPESEKQKISEHCAALRAEATKERYAYINALDPAILREINRRRVAKGKRRIHKTRQISSPYHLWLKDYSVTHPEAFKKGQFGTSFGGLWTGLSAEEKKPYQDRLEALKAENAQKEAENAQKAA